MVASNDRIVFEHATVTANVDRTADSVMLRTLADPDDAAGLNRLQAKLTRALDDFWAISARVEPDLPDLLLGELVHHTDANLGGT